jgi:uncharacterized protein YjiS (DUF1127 family)
MISIINIRFNHHHSNCIAVSSNSTSEEIMATRYAPVFSIRNALMAMRTVWERRRVVGQLGALDDYMLRDIGITRFDVTSVMAEPMFRDPTKKLAERADETRRAHRAAAREILTGGPLPNVFGQATPHPKSDSNARRAA